MTRTRCQKLRFPFERRKLGCKWMWVSNIHVSLICFGWTITTLWVKSDAIKKLFQLHFLWLSISRSYFKVISWKHYIRRKYSQHKNASKGHTLCLKHFRFGLLVSKYMHVLFEKRRKVNFTPKFTSVDIVQKKFVITIYQLNTFIQSGRYVTAKRSTKKFPS